MSSPPEEYLQMIREGSRGMRLGGEVGAAMVEVAETEYAEVGEPIAIEEARLQRESEAHIAALLAREAAARAAARRASDAAERAAAAAARSTTTGTTEAGGGDGNGDGTTEAGGGDGNGDGNGNGNGTGTTEAGGGGLPEEDLQGILDMNPPGELDDRYITDPGEYDRIYGGEEKAEEWTSGKGMLLALGLLGLGGAVTVKTRGVEEAAFVLAGAGAAFWFLSRLKGPPLPVVYSGLFEDEDPAYR